MVGGEYKVQSYIYRIYDEISSLLKIMQISHIDETPTVGTYNLRPEIIR